LLKRNGCFLLLRFGNDRLGRVHFETQARVPKLSASFYRDVIANAVYNATGKQAYDFQSPVPNQFRGGALSPHRGYQMTGIKEHLEVIGADGVSCRHS